MHQEEFHPDTIIHVVGKEQTDYFTVVFRAIEDMIPALRGKELHVKGGYVQLKGDVKMSSRLGNVITGDQLLQEIRTHVHAIMADSTVKDKQHIAEAITMAAVKYGLLKVGVSEDVGKLSEFTSS